MQKAKAEVEVIGCLKYLHSDSHAKTNLSTIDDKRGFTLIELAMVLVVIGIVLSLGVALIKPLTQRTKYSEANEIISAAVDSVISFGSANRKLPIQGDFTPDGTIDEFVEVVRNLKDAWTKTLYYIVDSGLITIPAGTNDAICGRKTTSLTVCRDVSCTVAKNVSNVAFAVISGGDNFNVQTGIITGSPCPAGQTCVRVYDIGTAGIDDCTNITNCPSYPAGELISRQEDYDDIVKWVTVDELRTKVGCASPQLSIVNTELPFGFRCSQYSATIVATGGVPFSSGGKYRWCTQGTLPTGLTINPNVASADCLALAEASWGQADSLSLSASSATLSQRGTFTLTFFARDNNDVSGSTNDNISQKTFTMTVNEQGNPIRVWNTGGATRDFTLGSSCRNSVNNNSEISDSVNNIFLNSGASCIRRSGTAGSCTTAVSNTITYDDAINVDSNCNYQINFTTVAVER